MKTLLLTIGPPGSGKSSWAKEHIKASDVSVWYISQDEQGKDGHIKKFRDALISGKDIIVDRMNFNEEQRKPYIEVARAEGYTVEARYFGGMDYKICLNNIVNREGHPTIKAGDIKTAREVLDMYWEKESVVNLYKEVDETWDYYGSNKKVLNLDDLIFDMNFKHLYVVTDPHGCFDDMMLLLAKMGYREGIDLLIIIGDLNDRGPQADKVIHFAFNTHFVFPVLGNHDIKLRKWLRGNKVQTKSLENTIIQLSASGMIGSQAARDDLYYKMMDMPYIIKADKNYFAHAGFHPWNHPENTTREFCLFARHFDSNMGTFTRESSADMWFNFPRKYPEFNLFFGHIVLEKKENAIILPTETSGGIYGMDGGICFGETARGARITLDDNTVEIFELPSTRPLKTKDDEWDYMNKFEPYDERVKKGLLSRKEKGDLVLYNYTEKCTFEKAWDKYTMESRGLILNKETGATVARPFPKFFNLGELENKNLPQVPTHESYTIEDKLDGSLGIMYLDTDLRYKIATRGSFESDQAIIGTEILWDMMFTKNKLTIEQDNRFTELTDIYTPVFEIIYPENRMNDGARLVCDYGNMKTLVLLAMLDKRTGKDAPDSILKDFANILHCPLRVVYSYTLDEVVAMQKTLPVTREGFVVKFKNGFRVKIKGDEYCRMQRILNGINPLAIWEQMLLSDTFELSSDYKKIIPEEIIDEVDDIERRIREVWAKKILDTEVLYAKLSLHTPRELGMYCHNESNGIDPETAACMFMIQKKQFPNFFKFVGKLIRPKNNIIG